MEWACRTCTLRNPETANKCMACENARDPRDACVPVTASSRSSAQPPCASPPCASPASGSREKPRDACRSVGIDREQQRRVEDEIRAKRRRQDEERERIMREFQADQSINTRAASRSAETPVAKSIPARAMPVVANASTVRIQLKSASRSLVCSCFGPEATLREVLAFANDEMKRGHIIRSELHPEADPEFVRRTQEMLRQTAPAVATFVSLRLAYPPRTQWLDSDLDVTLATAGLAPSCTLLLEADRSNEAQQASAPPGAVFSEIVDESVGSWELVDPVESDVTSLTENSDPSEEYVVRTPEEESVALAAERDRMLEAAERRLASAPISQSVAPVSFYSQASPSGPGSKTKRQQEEEKRHILQRAEEERMEREARRTASRAAQVEAQAALAAQDVGRRAMVQIRHPGGTEAVGITDGMTFEMLLLDLRAKLQLCESSEFTFRINYPPRRFSRDEFSLLVAESIVPPAVIILEQVPVTVEDSPSAVGEETPSPEPAQATESPPRVLRCPPENPARAAALAAAERRQHGAQNAPSQAAPYSAASVPALSSPISAKILPTTPLDATLKTPQGASAQRGAGMTSEERFARERQLAAEREVRHREKELILKQAEADQAFRAAKRMVPVGGVSNAPASSSSTPAQPAVRHIDMGGEPFLRLRDPGGVAHLTRYTSPDMTLADALANLNLDLHVESSVAQVPFPRRTLSALDWSTPLRMNADVFPHGTIVIVDASLQGEQRSGGAVVWDPFSPEGISEALPPALMDGTEFQGRMVRLADGQASEELVSAEEQCTICLCPFQLSDRLGTLPCAHRFHWDCIARSLRYTPACPFCRQC